jgi:hypothetical protein
MNNLLMLIRRETWVMTRNNMSDRSFINLPTACLPDAVLAPLVEMLMAIVRSLLTASKSKTPPGSKRRRSR